MADDFTRIEKNIGYSFRDRTSLRTALTHSSSREEHNYERYEFLGDRVLGLVMAEWLFEAFPDESEGDLAKRHAAQVQGIMLAKIAKDLDLGSAMIFSDAEKTAGGAENDNILADGLEALIAALYLEAGLEKTATLIRAWWGDTVHKEIAPPQDPKTALQEWAQGQGKPLPVYETVERSGPDHAPIFTVEVTLEGLPPVQASGPSLRKAEKDAAAAMLERLPS